MNAAGSREGSDTAKIILGVGSGAQGHEEEDGLRHGCLSLAVGRSDRVCDSNRVEDRDRRPGSRLDRKSVV